MCDLVEIIIILIKVIIYIYIYITTKMMMFVYSNYSSSGVLWVAPHSVAEIVACFENRVSKSTLRSYWVRVVLSPPTGVSRHQCTVGKCHWRSSTGWWGDDSE